MNKYLFLVGLFGMTYFYVQAQTQEPTLNTVLGGYLNVKDALVKSDSKGAATASAVLLKTITGINMSTIPAKDHLAFMKLQDKLAYDARHISESIDINHQREHFTSLSANMITLAKRAQLSLEAVYEDYCPMKKSYWLSSDTAIQNPYYGKTMPGCGKITTTLNPK
jgi:hypothetical protein